MVTKKSRPEIIAQPDNIDRSVHSENTWVVSRYNPSATVVEHPTNGTQSDGTEKYIEWAHSKNIGIMDINVPRYTSVRFPFVQWSSKADGVAQESLPFLGIGDEKRQEAEIRELVCYLWDNYLQLYNSENVFIMGVGQAYIGVKMLLLSRSDASPPGKSPRHHRPAQPPPFSLPFPHAPRFIVLAVLACANLFPRFS